MHADIEYSGKKLMTVQLKHLPQSVCSIRVM